MKFLLDHDVPDDLSYLLEELEHEVRLLREVLPEDASDESVLQFAHKNDCVLLTCNRDDFLQLANHKPHHGVIVVVRAGHEPLSARPCFVCWRVRAKLDSKTTSTSLNVCSVG